MNPITQYLLDLRIARWNALVGKMQLVREEGGHMVFLHPTKGFRKISKRRLGLA